MQRLPIRQHVGDIGLQLYFAFVQQDPFIAKLRHGSHIMAYEQHRSAFATADFIHFTEAFLLEFRIADGQHLVHHQYLGFQVGRHGEGGSFLRAKTAKSDHRPDPVLRAQVQQGLDACMSLRGFERFDLQKKS